MDNSKDRFVIEGLAGKKTLSGNIKINGSKNSLAPTVASSILFEDSVLFKNVPELEDLKRTKELFLDMGILVESKKRGIYKIAVPKKIKTDLLPIVAKRMRASILLTGPILSRFGEVSFPHPGGCVLGERPVDLFIEGFKKMGASVSHRANKYILKTKGSKLKGADIFFKVQSVTATETFIMAGILARGKTILRNVPVEPEITELINFLNKRGAKIKGVNTHTIEITGGVLLKNKKRGYKIMPDRLEAGSFLILGALCSNDLTISHCNPEHLHSIIESLKSCGVNLKIGKDKIHIGKGKNYKNMNIKTHEYPGFPTDLQAPMSIFLTQVLGESLVFETIFESRLNYVDEMNRMGANIITMDSHRVMIKGPTPLKSKELESPDIRAGLAYIIAAILAKGKSVIHNAYYIDRGYENIENRLAKIGVKIKRLSN